MPLKMVAARRYRRPARRRRLGAMYTEGPAGEDPTWMTKAAPTGSERPGRPMQRAAKRFAEAGSPGRDTSPQAVEATLASISEEVTADAIERRRDKGKPR